ncbi:hypothetical protein V501_01907 [Pseudogymnoascus sp. VKM F-4519 (FW-2642)]|nr:hypothetical protein V500_04896 [Pseudogymnoascus sp. VKM F-4518 (FW-2643)]KFZ17116.1 hypothetical protein V501_01907 [Pseudogymnoascus sp. VKM F-4519 (FW-2642)]
MALTTRHAVGVAHVQMKHTSGRQYRWSNVFFIMVMSLGSLGYGLSTAIIGTTLAQPFFFEYFELEGRPDLERIISLCVGLYQAGGFCGSIICPLLADKWGRKTAIISASVVVIITGALLCGSVNIGMFIAMRFFNGIGALALLVLIPVWMAEVAPPSVRGAMVVMHGVMIGLGYTAAQWIAYGFFHVHNNLSWRLPLLLQCIPLVFLIASMPWIPESPRYLLMVDNVDNATKVIRRLHHPEEATVELAQMTRQVAIDRTLDSSWIQMFKKPSYRKRSLMALVLASSTQMVGVLVISNYGPTIYKQLGFDADLQFIFQSATIMAGFFASPIAIWIVDRMPRNILLGACELGCVACLLVEAALDATMPEQHNIAGLRASVAMLFLFFMLFNGGVDCSVYPYLTEIFPTHLRVKGMSLAVSGICVTDLLWLMLAPTAFASIGWKYYLCFIIPAFVMALCILLFFPDTSGVPLEEIAAIFGDQDELYRGNYEGGKDAIADEERSSAQHIESDVEGKVDV